MVDTTNYLDFQDFYFNELIGDLWLGIAIGLIAINYLCARAKFPYQLHIQFSILWVSIVFAAYTQLVELWVFTGLVVGGIFYYNLNKIMQR